MDIDNIITNITRHKTKLSKENEEIHKKQSKITQNNRSVMEYQNKISKTKSIASIKNYYSRIATLERENVKLQKEIGILQKKSMNEQKEVNKLEKQMLNDINKTTYVEGVQMQEDSSKKISSVENTAKTYKEVVIDFCKYIKKNDLDTTYGKIENITNPGTQGGNGNILFGTLNNHDVAIKVLYNNESGKINRFIAEYINVVMSLQKVNGVVELFLYDSVEYEGEIIHYIVMKKYVANLVTKTKDVTTEGVIKLFYSLCEILKKVHEANIIHRDIKPENILVDENGKVVLCDFGIAYFDPTEYEYTGHTISKEILGNRKFSAPEQSNKDAIPHETMDIYALGQIIQWYVSGDTHSGTGRKQLIQYINNSVINSLDAIVDKCLRFDPKERYQSINEIYNDLKNYGITEPAGQIEERVIYDYMEENDNFDRGEEITIV